MTDTTLGRIGSIGDDDTFASLDATVAAEYTPLASLKEALNAPVEWETYKSVVPARPSIEIEYNTVLSALEFNMWRKSSVDKNTIEGVDPLKFACIVIANKAVAIRMGGKVVNGSSGKALTFRDKELHELVDAGTARETVVKIFANDAHIMLTANEIIEKAGFSPDALESGVDPTEA